MAKWGRADASKTEVFTTDDGDNFLELRVSLSKSEANRITEHAPLPNDDNRMQKIATLMEIAFETLVVNWSAEDDEGNALAPTIASYRDLDAAPARWIDEKVNEVVSRVMGIEVERAEGKLSE